MLRVAVIDAAGCVQREVDCRAGERLLDAFDDARAPVAFGCRSATCGICLLEVLEGGERLAAPDPVEAIALEELATSATDRLACRACAGPDDGVVEVRPRAAR